jgi:hypothetical protein
VSLLSDRSRAVSIPVLLVAIALLLAWWVRATADGRVGVLRILDEPPGSEVVLSLLRVRSIDGPDRYVVGKASTSIPVVGTSAGLRVGEELTVGGVVGEGFVEERWRAPAPARPAKKALGVAGLLIAAVVLGVGVRRSPEGLVPRG